MTLQTTKSTNDSSNHDLTINNSNSNDSNNKDSNREEQTSSSPTNKAAKLLADSVEKLMNSESYKAALSFRKKLYSYSFRNVWLIYCQLPTATMICGYKKWQELGRQVKKGEKSLAILAPLIKKDKETEEKEVFGFRSASVFDVSQTEGDPIPELPRPKLLEGDSEHIQLCIKQLEHFALNRGNPVSYQALKANGLYSLKTRAIIINETLEPLQRLKTLIHELAHALLHDQLTTEPTHRLELEAESCAYLVCDSLNLDTSQYSFAYLANWAEEPKELLLAAEKACKAADLLLEVINLEEYQSAYLMAA